MLRNKRILFVAPLFHGYEKMISSKLKEMGAEVYFYPERIYSLKFKIINNFFPKYLADFQAGYYNRLLSAVKDRTFDYLFVIRGYKITREFLEEFVRLNPGAKRIMYQWDSNRTNEYTSVIDMFDDVFSFDYEDCKKFNVKYLPLFYSDDIAALQGKSVENKYDFFFMGTYLPERYQALLNFCTYVRGTDYCLKKFIYLPKTSLIKEVIKGSRFDYDIVSTRHLSRPDYLDILKRSKIVVDVSNRGQTGLAMRIIEALSLEKKVMTDNVNIVNEPFYDSRNIYIFDATNPCVPDDFVRNEFWGKVETLSVRKWLEKIFIG